MKKKGFTLLELLVVISIITIITGIVFINYRPAQQQLALNRAASKLAQDIRRAQEMAMSTRAFTSCSGGVQPSGYGLISDTNQPTAYYMFADCNNNQKWDFGVDSSAGKINLEKDITVEAPSGAPTFQFLSIIFTSPDPAVSICHHASSGSCTAQTSGWVRLRNTDGKTRTVTVNQVGQIEID